MRRFLFILSLLFIVGCGKSPEVLMNEGFALYDAQDFTNAYPLLQKAFDKGLDDPELVARLAYCTINVANDPGLAIDLLRNSALKYPDYARTYYVLGYIAHEFGPTEEGKNLQQAIGFTRKAISLDSTNWRFMDNLGMFYLQMDNFDSALVWFKAAQEIEPEYKELNVRIEQAEELKIEKARLDSIAAVDSMTFKP